MLFCARWGQIDCSSAFTNAIAFGTATGQRRCPFKLIGTQADQATSATFFQANACIGASTGVLAMWLT